MWSTWAALLLHAWSVLHKIQQKYITNLGGVAYSKRSKFTFAFCDIHISCCSPLLTRCCVLFQASPTNHSSVCNIQLISFAKVHNLLICQVKMKYDRIQQLRLAKEREITIPQTSVHTSWSFPSGTMLQSQPLLFFSLDCMIWAKKK